MPSNEEYFERWENSAPVAVEELSPEQIARAKNRKSDDNPWESFEDEIMGEFSDPDLQAAIEEYASRVSDAAPTAQSDEELCRLQRITSGQRKTTSGSLQKNTPMQKTASGM